MGQIRNFSIVGVLTIRLDVSTTMCLGELGFNLYSKNNYKKENPTQIQSQPVSLKHLCTEKFLVKSNFLLISLMIPIFDEKK